MKLPRRVSKTPRETRSGRGARGSYIAERIDSPVELVGSQRWTCGLTMLNLWVSIFHFLMV